MTSANPPANTLARVRDVVCGMPVELREDTRLHRETWHGQAYFFCSGDCHNRFRDAPERYMPGSVSATTRISGNARARMIWLPLPGITCADCDHIESGLNSLTGVETVAVNETSRFVTVVFDPTTVTVDGFVEALQSLGVEAPVTTLRLRIEGIYCAACVVSIERELERRHGVRLAMVDFPTGEATVVYEPGKLDAATLGCSSGDPSSISFSQL